MANAYDHVYPEVAVARLDPWGNPLRERPVPGFPAACPRCGAEATATGGYYDPVAYACGGGYAIKPQIQNHTDKWWGACPVTRAKPAPEPDAS